MLKSRLRTFVVTIAALWVAAVLGVSAATQAEARAEVAAVDPAVAPAGVSLNKQERTLLALINKARTGRGLARLTLRASLYRAAKNHSRDMMRRDYFSHVSRDGSTIAQRARRAGYSSSGYSSWAVGEVLGLGSGSHGSAGAIFKSWMAHNAHRKVVLAARWRDIGLGAILGTYKGVSGVRIFTVDFGRRTR